MEIFKNMVTLYQTNYNLCETILLNVNANKIKFNNLFVVIQGALKIFNAPFFSSVQRKKNLNKSFLMLDYFFLFNCFAICGKTKQLIFIFDLIL